MKKIEASVTYNMCHGECEGLKSIEFFYNSSDSSNLIEDVEVDDITYALIAKEFKRRESNKDAVLDIRVSDVSMDGYNIIFKIYSRLENSLDQKTEDGRSAPFIVKDVASVLKESVVVELEHFQRHLDEAKGTGLKMLKNILRSIDAPIVVSVQSIKNLPKFEGHSSNTDSAMEKLVSYYSEMGFVNINSFVKYENLTAMMYDNKYYQRLKDSI